MSIRTWKIDTAHSSITFLVRHMLVSRVRGRFARWSGDTLEILIDVEAIEKARSEEPAIETERSAAVQP
jgi:polyisoprenoid-binding protein YceI